MQSYTKYKLEIVIILPNTFMYMIYLLDIHDTEADSRKGGGGRAPPPFFF